MWPFRKPVTRLDSSVFNGFTDWHSHILPAVDDGVQTMDEALAILRRYETLGVKSVWLTPHIMEDMPNTTARLRERFDELKSQYRGAVELHLAAENMMDNLFSERLAAGDLLPLGERADHLLVETSYFNPPINLYETLEAVKARGYYPVLAHPERYVYMGMADYRRLKEMGVKFQLNLPSVCGRYGRQVRATAERLRKDNLYDFTGTDIHNAELMDALLS